MMTDVAVGDGLEITGARVPIIQTYTRELHSTCSLLIILVILLLTVSSTGAVASLGKCRERDLTRILYTPNWLLTDMVWEVPVTFVVVVVVPTVT